LTDNENELTLLGWTCYLELTDAGPCPTNEVGGYKAKDPKQLYAKAQPRLEEIAKASAGRERKELLVKVSSIARVKFGGRQITLDDGTRWEVDDVDCRTADGWTEMDRVVIVDGEMFKLDDLKKVSVEQEI
jgi:hypothetical protein